MRCTTSRNDDIEHSFNGGSKPKELIGHFPPTSRTCHELFAMDFLFPLDKPIDGRASGNELSKVVYSWQWLACYRDSPPGVPHCRSFFPTDAVRDESDRSPPLKSHSAAELVIIEMQNRSSDLSNC